MRSLSVSQRVGLTIWVALVLGLGIAGIGVEERLGHTSLSLPGTRAAEADAVATREFGRRQTLVVVVEGTPSAVARAGPRLAGRLRGVPSVEVVDPWSSPSRALRPAAGRAVLVVAVRRSFEDTTAATVPRLRAVVAAAGGPGVRAHLTGYADISRAIHAHSVEAIKRAELIAAPLLLLVLLLVLGSPVAAAVPMLFGASVVVATRGVLSIVNEVQPLDATSLSIATMMGLALGVDYGLLIVTRHRQELRAGATVPQAAAIASATAGRTVRTAAIVLSCAIIVALALTPGSILVSATAGTLAVAALSLVGTTLAITPVLLLLGRSVERWAPWGGGAADGRLGSVMAGASRHPRLLGGALGLALLALCVPALRLATGPPMPTSLPAGAVERRDFEAVRGLLGAGWVAPYAVTAVSRDGPVTSPEKLRRFAAFERELRRAAGVKAVLGPAGTLVRRTAPVGAASSRFADARRGARQAATGARRLDAGLVRADVGARALEAGIADAAAGAHRLARGTGAAAAGGRRLAGGVAQAQTGVRRLYAGVREAAAGVREVDRGAARVDTGARQLADGIGTLRGRLGEALPAVEQLAGGLAARAGDLRARQARAAAAEAHAASAVTALEQVAPAAQEDGYAQALAAARQGLAALGGGDGPSLSAQLAGDADAADAGAQAMAQVAQGTREAVAALDQLGAGAGALRAGTGRLAAGSAQLADGAGRLEPGARELRDGLGELSGGSGTLTAGLRRLDDGAGALGTGLRDARGRVPELSGGITRLQNGSARLRDGTARLRGGIDGSRRLDPVLGSGYARLAALDGASAAERAAAGFAMNVERGGTALQYVVVSAGNPIARDAALPAVLDARAGALAARTGTDTYVGGPAPTIREFDRAVGTRIPLLVVALSAVTYVGLVVVLRSLLLPLVGLLLNTLTVGAAFGVLALAFGGVDPPLGGPGYVDDIMAVAVLTIVLALSLDYQIFLLAGIREGHRRTGTTDGALRFGLERTAGVITGAAAIMCAVFAAFALSEMTTMRQLGIGLTVAVAIDATIVRLVLLPMLLRRLGAAAWWMPPSLAHRIPERWALGAH